MKPRQISDLCQRRNFCSRQRPPLWFFQDDVLIGCRISFLTTSSSEIEVCFFFCCLYRTFRGGRCVGSSCIFVSNLPFRKQQVENARPKGVCKKRTRRSCRICVTSKSIRAESTSSTIRSARKYEVSLLRSHKNIDCIV